MRKREGLYPVRKPHKKLRNFSNGAGLTLIELLVSILVFSIIVVSLYSAFSVGLAAYRKGEKVASLYQKIRLSLDSIALDLRNSYRFSDKDAEFLAENNKLSFYTLKPIYSKSLSESLQICKVEYWLEEKKLFRKVYCGTLAFRDEAEVEPELLLSNVVFFNARFPYEAEENKSLLWKDYWKEPDKLPLVVKISLQIEDPDARTQPITLIKSIFLPIGKLGKEEK